MAIEDDGLKDREVWSSTSCFWYEKAADKSPNSGRLYHRLIILARPYTLEQLSLYARSLTCIAPVDKLVRDDLSSAKVATRLWELETFAAISNIAALFEYDTTKHGVKARLRLAYELAQILKDVASEAEPCNPNELGHRSLLRKTL